MSVQYQLPRQINHFSNPTADPLQHGGPHSGVRTPEWMLNIGDLLKSSVDGFEDHAQLFTWKGASKRKTTGDLANLLFTSATLGHSLLELEIPNGSYAPVLETKMNTGEHLELVTIVRLGNAKALKVKLQTIAYGNCRIGSFEQTADRLFLELYVTTRENTVFEFGQDGVSVGQTVSKVDYSKNTAE